MPMGAQSVLDAISQPLSSGEGRNKVSFATDVRDAGCPTRGALNS